MYMCIYTHTYIYIYISIYICSYIHIYICTYIYIYIYIFLNTYVRTHTHTYAYIYKLEYMYTRHRLFHFILVPFFRSLGFPLFSFLSLSKAPTLATFPNHLLKVPCETYRGGGGEKVPRRGHRAGLHSRSNRRRQWWTQWETRSKWMSCLNHTWIAFSLARSLSLSLVYFAHTLLLFPSPTPRERGFSVTCEQTTATHSHTLITLGYYCDLQHTASHCNLLQHTTTHCNTHITWIGYHGDLQAFWYIVCETP